MMTYEEALERLVCDKFLLLCASKHPDEVNLDEIDIAKAAIEKQIPKKPKTRYGVTYYCPNDCGGEEFDEYGDILICPNCGEDIEEGTYCRYCGQRLDRSDVDAKIY